ncbi:MAG: PHP domain-containing protein [Elusimicrobiota bacterium]|jgi:predicted metal-dependent phosphoesterase TrpH|nr:PHP domain-containing protein [Elusimicrobiota bacterium]
MSNEKFADLHLHTTFSDGSWTPTEVVLHALEKNLSAIAITDHDTVDGIAEAMSAAKGKNIEVIAGLELSSFCEDLPKKEIHILGYFVDYESSKFKQVLADLKAERQKRALDIFNKLKENGAQIKDDSFMKNSNQVIGRLHFAKALMVQGVVSNTQEAFYRFLGQNSPAYVPKKMLEAAEAVSLIKKAGGIPVLAHPFASRCDKNYVEKMIDKGIEGIEVWHIKQEKRHSNVFIEWAKEFGLIETGGSDCHGDFDGKGSEAMGRVKVPYIIVENLQRRLRT